MFRAVSWTLHQRRYRVLAIVMLLVAIACIGAGTFEVHRYREKVDGNHALKANARAARSPLTPALVALTAGGPPPGDTVKYRSVGVTGTYEPGAQTYVGNQSQGGRQGFFVLTPLRTSVGTLLVARGFVASTADETRPAHIPAPPTGTVSIVGRLYPTQTSSDQLGQLGDGEITAINAGEQAARLGTPVYQAWLGLDAGRPGASGLRAVPGPQLSNPTGGASEWQLLSYVVQWYVFALLALLAPFFFARSDARDAQRRYLGIDPDEVQFDLAAGQAAARRQLTAHGSNGASASPTAALVRRQSAEAARRQPVPPRLAQAQRLADRYGRSLGPDPTPVPDDSPPLWRRESERESVPRSSRDAPHRSDDAYHGSYNDYLWQLALADGEAPDVALSASARDGSAARPRWQSVTEHGPRVIDGSAGGSAPAAATPQADNTDETSEADR